MTTLSKLFGTCEIQIKNDNTRSFTAYGNTKHNIDKVRDVAMDGCYTWQKTPALLWSHDRSLPPLGPIKHIEEDTKGLLFEGRLSKTPRGDEIYVLAKDSAIDRFSIGYWVIDEKWNNERRVNELHKVDVQEISFVNFACNDESLLQDIKSHIDNGELPTKRELQNFLREGGMSKRQAEVIANQYNPTGEKEFDLSQFANSPLFQA